VQKYKIFGDETASSLFFLVNAKFSPKKLHFCATKIINFAAINCNITMF